MSPTRQEREAGWWARYSTGHWPLMALTVLATAGFWIGVRSSSWFFSDDYIAFHLADTHTLGCFLRTPIDVHFLPLHRLATWLLFKIFALNFDAAVLVMCAFHVAGIWMLYRCLNLIGESPLNGPLAALCGTNSFAALVLIWWTVGIARFPYVLLSLVGIYHYLKFRQGGSSLRIPVVVACVVGAAAFFTKALLLPGVLVALELALLPGTPPRKVLRNAAVALLVVITAAAYYGTGVAYGVDTLKSPPFNWEVQAKALQLAGAKVAQSLAGLRPADPLSVANWTVVACWGVLFCASIWRDRFNAVVWFLGAGVVTANFLVITLSQRMIFGAGVVTNDRYYFENLYLIVLFVAVVLKRMRIEEWLATTRSGRAAVAGAWIAVVVMAAGSQARFVEIMRSEERYAPYGVAREFGRNLTESLAELRRSRQGTLRFEQDLVPLEVLKMAAMEVRRYAEVLPLFDPDVEVIDPDVDLTVKATCLYRIRDNGTIIPPAAGCS